MSKADRTSIELDQLIDMIGNMASLDFSKRLDVEISDAPLNVIAYGLNMLSEELESNIIKKSFLKEVNANLEKFSYTVAHDMRSPLNTAIALVSLIEEELGNNENETLKEYLSFLKQIHLQTTEMVAGILEYSRTNFSNITNEIIDVNKICGQLIAEYSIQSNVIITCGSDMPQVHYNLIALRQIFSNLINNAIKYSDKEVCVLDIQYAERETYYEFSIADNGPGIINEDLNRVFELFENFKTGKKDSYGIGLAVVKKLVNQAHGDVWVESLSGEGAKFVFTIMK